jgi:peptidoglycan-N-acetylmuramic acid deacetylase
MRRANSGVLADVRVHVRAGVAAALLLCTAAQAASCDKPVYLTFDTGHMEVAPLVADVLQRHQVKVTFFLANERTRTGGTSLDDVWAPWWKARATEGHAFGSHTWDHDSWLADLAGGALKLKPSAGPTAGQVRELSPAAYCAEVQRPADRFKAMTGQRMGAIFRAPGGKTSPALLKAAAQCGWAHVGWAPAGFLGDELPSDKYPNAQLLQRALQDIKPGDILVAHLGIWSRRDVWAPAVLEPLITGLKSRGLCFATLNEHPQLGAAAQTLR